MKVKIDLNSDKDLKLLVKAYIEKTLGSGWSVENTKTIYIKNSSYPGERFYSELIVDVERSED